MFQCVCCACVCVYVCKHMYVSLCACIHVYLFYCLVLKQMWEPKGHTHSPVFRSDWVQNYFSVSITCMSKVFNLKTAKGLTPDIHVFSVRSGHSEYYLSSQKHIGLDWYLHWFRNHSVWHYGCCGAACCTQGLELEEIVDLCVKGSEEAVCSVLVSTSTCIHVFCFGPTYPSVEPKPALA